MIVYVKLQSGEIYASPVFAEIGKGWNRKSVVLNQTCDGLILLPLLNKGLFNRANSNYFYIDETVEVGWIQKRTIRGFAEIIQNKAILNALKRGKNIPIGGLEIAKRYNLPLQVINDFEVKTEQDISTFDTVCWGLHDANIEDIKQVNDDLIVNFDTTWEKHIIMTFHNVKEAHNLENLACILDSTFNIDSDYITWEVVDGFDFTWKDLVEKKVYVVAQRITWKLVID